MKIKDLDIRWIQSINKSNAQHGKYDVYLLGNDKIQDDIIDESKLSTAFSKKRFVELGLDSQDTLEYGDLLFYKTDATLNIAIFNVFSSKVILPDETLFVIRPDQYLSAQVERLNFRKNLLIKIEKIVNAKSDLGDVSIYTEFQLIDLDELIGSEKSNYLADSHSADVEEVNEKISSANDIDFNYETLDYSKIRVTPKQSTVNIIIQRLKHGEINLETEFQRRPNLWNADKMSSFIESLLLSIPVPTFYFDEGDSERWQVVDGLQRLSTLKRFMIDDELELQNLDYLVELDGKKYSQLERKFQRKLDEAELTTVIIDKNTPQAFKYGLFKRINSGMLTLNDQEIRHALNPGRPATFIKKIADSPEVKMHLELAQSRVDRMEDREFILRYFAFRMNDVNDVKGSLSNLLDQTMTSIRNYDSNELDKWATELKHALTICRKIQKENIFKRSFDINQSQKTRISKTLFDVWTVTLSKLSFDQRLKLVDDVHIPKIRTRYRALLKQTEFEESLSSYSTVQNKTRFKMFDKMVKNILK